MNPRRALNGLQFDMEPAVAYVQRAFPAAVTAENRLLESIAALALDCVANVPTARPSAAICVTLLGSLLLFVSVIQYFVQLSSLSWIHSMHRF